MKENSLEIWAVFRHTREQALQRGFQSAQNVHTTRGGRAEGGRSSGGREGTCRERTDHVRACRPRCSGAGFHSEIRQRVLRAETQSDFHLKTISASLLRTAMTAGSETEATGTIPRTQGGSGCYNSRGGNEGTHSTCCF